MPKYDKLVRDLIPSLYGSEQLDLLTKNVSEIEIKRWINNVKT